MFVLKIKLLEPSVGYSSNTYLVCSGDECALIDPASKYDPSVIEGRLKYIILTHGHYDHIINLDEWVKNSTAPVLVAKEDSEKLSDSIQNCATLFGIYSGGYFGKTEEIEEGDRLSLGDSTISVLKTPGHTEGSVSLLIDGSLFVGDTIFAGGGFGKCSFPGGSFPMIKKSILRLTELDENITVYPGHGEATTIGQYKKDIFR